MPTKRNPKQRKQRKSKKVRRGGAEDRANNLRNCQNFYHPFDQGFCTRPVPGGDGVPIDSIDYPGLKRGMMGLATPTSKKNGRPVHKFNPNRPSDGGY